MVGGFITCTIVSLIMILIGYQIHIKKRLFLIAGYQEGNFIGDKNKLAKIFGMFSYLVGVVTFLLPFGLESLGDIVGIIFGVLVVLSTIGVIIWANLINKPL
ncbi:MULTISPECIES: DUF3784 domain-containing protein [Bacillus]|uniref:DUF3784 domain-containing protein n=2 Tax=Bacillus cereus group TaxID=86661 RepID=A0AA44TH26_BACCE|nr:MULTISPECIES: DUF3784 domain-containing protein [Bacillus]MCI0768431.1 DUF3784 domain-containing protein [Bacillus sp. TL12]OOR00619.1 DUF3784 domain-containing protein [Bacillus mycoides]PFN07536.1 DUF3784 domain-containing protein [Bacillus cereus]PFS04632.1 DUF3784 domain-containing protein [Bacillus cereus]